MTHTLLRIVGLLAVFTVACSPVAEPLTARQPRALTMTPAAAPRVMWVLDNSGSLETPVQPVGETCGSCGPGTSPCPLSCLTRKRWLVSALREFDVPPARHGAMVYPTDSRCGSDASLTLAPPVAASSSPDAVIDAYEARSPAGGTPTSKALQTVLSTAPAEETSDTFVMLVTDGMPNCNMENVNTCNTNACRCTLSSCVGSFCSEGCLDDLGVINQAAELAARGLRLMIIGVGEELVAPDANFFSSVQTSLPPTCASNADCPGNSTCVDGLCASRFHLVLTAPDMNAPRVRLRRAMIESTRCLWISESPFESSVLTVQVNDTAVEPGPNGWVREGTRRLRFTGTACDELIAAPDAVLTVTVSPS
ncbi:MAG: VWA domain-containing protein [Archangium sp.]|nr:VWA domain-containing protein [Archangium sp.]